MLRNQSARWELLRLGDGVRQRQFINDISTTFSLAFRAALEASELAFEASKLAFEASELVNDEQHPENR